MKELAYHILDIANNSVRGEAVNIEIKIHEDVTNNKLLFTIKDNGKGIEEKMLSTIKDPFTTSRTFRKVGLGIPLLNDTCTTCGGELIIKSVIGEGTIVEAWMEYNNIDRPPLGNMASTMTTLMTSDENISYSYTHSYNENSFTVTTRELREILGDIPLHTTEVVIWLKEYILENLNELRVS